MSTFSDRLKKLREQSNLSQSELASRIDIAKSTLAMYETGKREPKFDTVRRIADFFDVSADYLLGQINEPLSKEVARPKSSVMTQAEIEEFINNPNMRPKYKGRELTDEEIIRLSKVFEAILDRTE